MTPNADAAAYSTSFRKARLEGTPLSRSRHQCALARPESRRSRTQCSRRCCGLKSGVIIGYLEEVGVRASQQMLLE